MKKNTIKLTTAQFARLHNINKRTLHYYDSIGLFPLIQRVKTAIAITTCPRVLILNPFSC